jgi:vacuolar-type H+-ATPase subunit D/Vma8
LKYWERVRRTVNLANAPNREKAKAERHRLYIASGQKKFLKMRKRVTYKMVRRAYKLARRRITKEARKVHREVPQISVADAKRGIEATLFQDEQYPTHFRSDVEPEMLP